MVLETKNLILRKWEETDAEYLYEYAKVKEIGETAGWIPHKSVIDSKNIIRTVLSDFGCFAIFHKNDKHIIGSIDLLIGKESNIKNVKENEAELGYWMAIPYQGKGYMKEAVDVILKYAFYDLKLESIWLGYFDGNDKSKQLAINCGFMYHHIEKDILWEITHEIKTEHIMLLRKEEYENI